MAEPICPVQAVCGGCPLLPLDRNSELQAKLDLVSASLMARGIEADVSAAPAGPRFGYRNRLRMKVVDGQVEFFNQAKHDGCLVVRPDLWEGIEQVLSLSARPALLAGVAHVEVRVGDDGELGLVTATPVDRPRLVRALGSSWVTAERQMVHPPSLRYWPTDDVQVEVPLTSFVQVNSTVNRALVGEVVAQAEATNARTFLDLYSGAGNFTLPLGHLGLTGTAVETAGAAILGLAASVTTRGHAIQCIEGDARILLSDLSSADLIVADPPRSGLQDSHADLARLVTNTLILVGCKVRSFANDVAALSADGLELASVKVFDMFPGTQHVEALAVFQPR